MSANRLRQNNYDDQRMKGHAITETFKFVWWGGTCNKPGWRLRAGKCMTMFAYTEWKLELDRTK